eukprot:scaffold27299_cov19-Tisochrysis_lutea.AAC.2
MCTCTHVRTHADVDIWARKSTGQTQPNTKGRAMDYKWTCSYMSCSAAHIPEQTILRDSATATSRFSLWDDRKLLLFQCNAHLAIALSMLITLPVSQKQGAIRKETNRASRDTMHKPQLSADDFRSRDIEHKHILGASVITCPQGKRPRVQALLAHISFTYETKKNLKDMKSASKGARVPHVRVAT